MSPRTIRIATRASKLALWQAGYVRDAILAAHPDCRVELVEVVSTGDTVRDRPLYEVGTVGLFTKEVQEAVLDGRADVAVHSLKDLPTQAHAGLVLAAVPARGPAGDAFLSPKYHALARLPPQATIATSSLRRRAQILRFRPDLKIVDIRGNVETRIRKLVEEDLDGLVLAIAGIHRLGLDEQITEYPSLRLLVPAVGQGALGIECRVDDTVARELVGPLEHPPTRQAVDAERAFLHLLKGGCQVPIGAHAEVREGELHLDGIVLSADGSECFEGEIDGPAEGAAAIGIELAERLLFQGARTVLVDRNAD